MISTLKGVATLGTAKVIVDIVDKGNREIRPCTPMNPSFVTIHNTGNSGRGANAKSHNTYIHNMAGKSPLQTGYASWHFSVDDKFIYQHLPLNETAWHTGDGSLITSGNRTSIGIEICENPETNTKQAEENAIALTVWLLKNCNISVNNVKPHKAWSGKHCPRVILNRDGSFTKFHNRIKDKFNFKVSTNTSTNVNTSTNLSVGKGFATTDIWTQKNPSFSETGRVKVIKKGATYKVYREENGYYNLGGNEWVSKKYFTITEPFGQPVVIVGLGEVTGDVWTQKQAKFSSTGRVKIVEKGSRYKVYEEVNGYYRIGTEWISKNYFKIITPFSN